MADVMVHRRNLSTSSIASMVQRRNSLWLPHSDDSGRFWREEVEDGAVYHVELKKVVYNSFPDDTPPDDDTCRLAWETLKIRQIKAGTLEKLVESLIKEDGQMDSTYVNTFLATYRAFASTEQVLTLLYERYRSLTELDMKDESRDIHRKTLRSVIHVWLDTYPDDFRSPPSYQCLNTLLENAKTLFKDTELANRAGHKLHQFRKYEQLNGQLPDVKYFFSQSELQSDYNPHRAYQFMEIPSEKVAEQLTHIDADLFRKVLPHHCLGAVWSKRGKDKDSEAPTITATIDQFNAVLYRVVTTILKVPSHKTSHRAKVIMKWLDIAQELRALKNFSSMKAIISGLQSNPIYRLHKTWTAVSKDYKTLFSQLSEIFSEENNQINCRTLLMKEGTAKFVENDTKGTLKVRRSSSARRKSWFGLGSVSGTVPYLGTFLTDLTMIDTAIPDLTDNGLINFDKKRKEFEVIVQLKLLQSAAQTYQILPDPQFRTWFDGIDVFDEKVAYDISCRLEPPTSTSSLKKKTNFRLSIRRASIESLPAAPSHYSSSSDDRMSLSSTNSSSSPSPKSKRSIFNLLQMRHSMSVGSLENGLCPVPDPKSGENCIIKSCVETIGCLHDPAVYHSVQLRNNDHTSDVIQRVLVKHGIESPCDEYNIAQLLPDGEFLIPEKCNVFYAMNNSVELLFVVRHKSLDTPKKQKKGIFRIKTPRKTSSSSSNS